MAYDRHFHNITAGQLQAEGDFEKCTFEACTFDGENLSGLVLTDCTFEHCSLSRNRMTETALRNVTFRECQLQATDFGHCNAFGFAVSFENSYLGFCTFHDLKMSKAAFLKSKLLECFFSACDLTDASFAGSNLERTLFESCQLRGADFRGCTDFIIDPTRNNLRRARFLKEELEGLLAGFDLRIE